MRQRFGYDNMSRGEQHTMANAVGASLVTTGDLVARMSRRSDWPDREELYERARRLVDAGFAFIELTTDLGNVVPDLYDEAFLNWLFALHEDRGVFYTVHLPFYSIGVSSHVESVRRASVENTLAWYRRFSVLPVHGYVLHVGTSPLLAFADVPEVLPASVARIHDLVLSATRRSLDDITAVIARNLLFVENLPDVPFALTDRAVQEADTLTCFDIGHAYMRFDPVDEQLHHWQFRIAHIHFHDVVEQRNAHNRKLRRDHQALGQGIIDVGRHARWIAAHLPQATVCLEMDVENACASLAVWRQAVADSAASTKVEEP